MLRLLIGPSGSGKTHTVLSRLDALTEQGQENILWLVPEQHSFESERALLSRLGPQRAVTVQVLSFSRLAERVFRQVGGVAGRLLDEGTRALLMSRALEQVAAVAEDEDKPMQGLRPRLVTDSDYVEQLTTLWQELRQCAVSTENLEQVAARLTEEDGEEALLTAKVKDLYRVFAVYEGLAADTGADELDRLTRLAEALPNSTLPDDATIFVDGFKGFTVQELAVLEQLLPRCREMTVTLGMDAPATRHKGQDRSFTLFSPVGETAQQLRRLAENHAIPCEMEALTDNHRTESAALQALERGLYAPSPIVCEEAAPEVTVIPCESVYEECRVAVQSIHRLLRQGLRCRDVVVVMRNPADYAGILDEWLTREGIPCYMDTRQDLLCEPLVAYIRAALRVAVGGWNTEELMRLMKTDLWKLSPTDIAEMENYVYTWRIEGSQWEREWTENPAGLDKEMHTPQRILLERLNRRRQALVDSLTPLRQALRGTVSGRQFATAVYGWLTSQGDLAGRMARQAETLEQLAQPLLASHAARLWDEVMGVLDRFVLALDNQRLPASRFEDLFTMLCGMIDLGTIPQGLDAVTVGGVDRIRYNSPRAALILGANEGVLPAYPMGDGLLTEEERDLLKSRGLSLAGDVLTQCVEERYFAYMAVAAPSERLIVTYQNGGETGASPVVSAIRRILPNHCEEEASRPDGTDLETVGAMFERLAHSYDEPSPLSATLHRVVGEDPRYAHRLQAVERAATANSDWRMENRDITRQLYGTDLCLSATQTDVYYKCRFRYFCQYGLRVQPRRTAKIDSSIFGTLVHYAMEILLPRYCRPDGLVDELRAQEQTLTVDPALMGRLQADVRQVLEQYVEEMMGGLAEKDGRFLYQFDLALRSACNILWHTLAELQQSQFTPVDFELNIHPEEDTDAEGILSIRLPTAAGSVQVRGKVDRVDLFVRFDGTAFIRVVDYKTGSTTFELSHLTAGQSTQMLMYLYILCDNSRRYLPEGGQVRPGGVLYHPVTDLVVDRKDSHKQANRLRRMKMSGMVLSDPSVILAMERDTAENFIPAKLDKGGNPAGHVATAEQFRLLRQVIETLLVQMAEGLLEGDIRAYPIKDGERTACDYCDYKAVCGRDAEDPMNELKNQRFAAAMAAIEEEVAADERA